ncbi:phage regulatory CII family protein [uncultured Pseudacidovorax sp.]|uniref:phage regulatory CII family protein n=1 Tax=uncultured Pseudacidovorax sp. TaxID=679313 RepID=UPI0025F077DB|nr:phage regulatory CII family protein [uncultured Pseudacidovorax sp.]
MHISFTMSSLSGHVEEHGALDTSGPMSLADAIYAVAHEAPCGLDSLARDMRLPPGTLNHKVNPNNTTHFLRPDELQQAQLITGMHYPLHVMAAALGYVCVRATPDQAGGDPIEAVMRLQVAVADFARSVADAVQIGEGGVTPNAARRVQAMAQELMATVGHNVGMVRGRMRPAPPAAEL